MALGWYRIPIRYGVCNSVITYQVGTLVTTGALGTGFVPGIVAVGLMVGNVVYLMKKGDAKAKRKLAMSA